MIKLIQSVSGNLYAYDSITNKIITLNLYTNKYPSGEIADSILHKLNEDKSVQNIPLSCVRWKMSFDDCWEQIETHIPKLVLEMTTSCNLNCWYCDVSGMQSDQCYTRKTISKETVKSAIDFFMKHNENCKNADISFYGGEALLEFDLIKYAVKYANATIRKKTLSYDVSTNGLLLNEQIASWLEKNKNVQVTCTVNGPYHDQYRVDKNGQGSLNNIIQNLLFIRHDYPQVWENQIRFIANVNSECEIPAMLDYYDKILEKKPLAITNIVWNDNIMPLIENRPIVDFQNSNSVTAYYMDQMWAIKHRPIVEEEHKGIIPSCLPCEVKLFVHNDGKLSFCEKLCKSVSIGDLETEFNKDYLRSLYEKAAQLFDSRCKTCWAQRLCKVCLAPLFNMKGQLIDNIPEEICSQEKSNIEWLLSLYCQMSEENPDLLDYR